jgi:para-nitrobenzyl esterase
LTVPPGSRYAGILCAVALLGLSLSAPRAHSAASPEVRVGETVLVGRAGERDPAVSAFFGIPFAAPPVGELRWRAPQPAALPPGRRDATRIAPACYQDSYNTEWYRGVGKAFEANTARFPEPPVSEDCLYLNVWTPRAQPGAGLPVMVWIYGGANRSGWSFEPNYRGEALAGRGVVVVSLAYRVGIFGFFGHAELDGAANFGLRDQIAALHWVREHIVAFGGDAENVTLFGESAGAADIGYLMRSPAARGLFRRAISQSGGYHLLERRTRADMESRGLALASALPGRLDLAGLRAADSAAIWAASESALADDELGPSVDGEVVMAAAAEGMLAHPAAIDLLVGTNQDEWYMYVDENPASLDAAIAEYPPGSHSALRALAASEPTPRRGHDRAVTFANMVCPAYRMAGAARAAGVRAFVYRFTRIRPGPGGERLGAYHGAEIPYVFDTHDTWLPTDEADHRLTDQVMRYWVNFARSGDPNGPGLPAWPAYDAGDPRVLALGDRVEPRAAPDHALCLELADVLYGARQ